MENLKFEEIKAPELNGNGRDFIEGMVAGVAIVGGIAAVVALT